MGVMFSAISNGLSQSFNLPTPNLTEKNLPDQSGKVFLITGANAGVGYEVSRILYSLNGTVYMGCRTESKARTAITAIQSAHPSSSGKLIYLHLNLSDLTTIKSTADTFLAQEKNLHWLNNNAGVMIPPTGSKTTQNHDLQMGTNVLGHYLLTKLLLPALKSAAAQFQSQGNGEPVRVSWASSVASDAFSPWGGVPFDANGDPKPMSTDAAYGASKAANWFLAYEFARRNGSRDGVLHNAYNPGNLKTELSRHMEGYVFGKVARAMTNTFFCYPAVFGAYTELYAGLSRDLTMEKDQAGFVIPWGRKSTWNRDDLKAEMKEGGGSEKLWDWCERETRQYA